MSVSPFDWAPDPETIGRDASRGRRCGPGGPAVVLLASVFTPMLSFGINENDRRVAAAQPAEVNRAGDLALAILNAAPERPRPAPARQE